MTIATFTFMRALGAPLFRVLCCLLGVLAGCKPAPSIDDFTLELKAQPAVLLDDGKPVVLRVSALNPGAYVGKGSVVVQTSAGNLIDGETLRLDDFGTAQVPLLCDIKLESACARPLTAVATWDIGGIVGTTVDHVLTAKLVVKTYITDARASACDPSNQHKVLVGSSGNIKLAVADNAPLMKSLAGGTTEGLSIYDPATRVAAVAVRIPTVNPVLVNELSRIRAIVNTTGEVSNPIDVNFATWDGFDAVRSAFELAGTDALITRLDAISAALGASATGLVASAPSPGPFKGVMTVTARSATETELVLALVSAAGLTSAVERSLDDLAGGSALARSADQLAPSSCETFPADKVAKADLVWVVDDSGSMGSSQVAVAAVGQQIAAKLTNSGIDFRVAGVSTGYYPPSYDGSIRDWTASTATMLSWFASGVKSWGTNGDGDEEGFSGLKAFLEGSHPIDVSLVPGLPRDQVPTHIIFLSDAPEQSGLDETAMRNLFQTRLPNRRVVAHGVLCPESTTNVKSNCGDSNQDIVDKYHSLVRSTGGVLGSIKVFNATPVTNALAGQQRDVMSAVFQKIIAGAGYPLAHIPVGSSIRVAASATQGACDNTDIPRHDDNGWQIDLITGKVSFAGSCSPKQGSTVAVSYQHWTH